ncbi:ATP-grasp domain-containing protein [uncultured Methanolobus sp.]|uniref:ATP-grasp domain-containing protein n=1 Tax=uncultured Methanolobus sp. TaxID=218300 RepID=UPI0029C87162|nr:ATP-grasp domain-containing protein [uncultured Methanolobus sp.]
MDDISVLITGAGAPGIKGTLFSLKNNFDSRRIKTIGTDVKEGVVGKYLCDVFHKIPHASEPEYLDCLLNVCKKEKVDVVLPQNTAELLILSENKKLFEDIGSIVAISNKESIEIANDKYQLIKLAEKIGIPTAKSYLVDTFDGLLNCAQELGWPEKPVVIKPPNSNGMRGVRIIKESIDLKYLLYNEKPNNLYVKMDYLEQILGSSFPLLIIMEYLSNDEYTVDLLNTNNLITIPRARDSIRSGITFEGTVLNNQDIIKYSKLLANEIGLEYAFGFQFKLDECNVPKIIESNPRIQGTMVLSTFAGANIIYGAVKHALKEPVPDFNVKWGTKIQRYWGGIGVSKDKIVGSL